MTEKPNPQDARKAAVQAFRDREAAAARAKEDQKAAEQEKAKVLAQNRQQWSTASDTIHRGVMASSEAFAREGSEYTIPSRPHTGVATAVTYDIQQSGSLNIVATITFAMDTDGMVRPSTIARGCDDFPPPTDVAFVTAEWATEATDIVMIAVLRGQQMRVPD